ncbi:MAG TPA: YbjN domain-containing protein [Gemmatimonadaceae bacterium]|nr:YbjN domain-containing protein [Gemmatimonadaceae bacterium]
MSVLRTIRWFAVLAFAVVLAAPASAQIRERITSAQLQSLLKEKGIDITSSDTGKVVTQLNGSKVVFFISGQTMQAYFGLSGTGATLTKVNEWNKKKRFGRAYIDADGDPCVELDYDLEGGVSDDSIKVWFDTVKLVVRSFRTHVS